MAVIQVSARRRMNVPAPVVYECIANYQDHHHRFLPPAFSEFHVVRGGHGAGSVVKVNITAAGRTRSYHLNVTEVIPGRLLEEADTLSSARTRFQVLPEGSACEVLISIRWQSSGGVGGFFERAAAPYVTRRLLEDELRRLETYAARLAR